MVGLGPVLGRFAAVSTDVEQLAAGLGSLSGQLRDPSGVASGLGGAVRLGPCASRGEPQGASVGGCFGLLTGVWVAVTQRSLLAPRAAGDAPAWVGL